MTLYYANSDVYKTVHQREGASINDVTFIYDYKYTVRVTSFILLRRTIHLQVRRREDALYRLSQPLEGHRRKVPCLQKPDWKKIINNSLG